MIRCISEQRLVVAALHILTWSFIFLSPVLFHSIEENNWAEFLRATVMPLFTCVVFYINYLLLIPYYFLRHRTRIFLVVNVFLVLLLLILFEWHIPFVRELEVEGPELPTPPTPMPRLYFIGRTFLMFVFSVGIAIALRLSMKWKESEEARDKAELEKTLAELENIKNQINPHFLLNTLNNIYALTAINAEKAQQAIQQLSIMLRYILYENKSDFVPLARELEFLRMYIALMRLRLSTSVSVDFDVLLKSKEIARLRIAPLIFISLVENAFKHGVSASKPSFIRIRLTYDAAHDELIFCCENSNNPKNLSDKSPGGIGLQQVKSRLAYAYPKRFCWNYGATPKGDIYRSEIRIKNQPSSIL